MHCVAMLTSLISTNRDGADTIQYWYLVGYQRNSRIRSGKEQIEFQIQPVEISDP